MSEEKKVPEWNEERERYWMGEAMLVQDGCNVSGIVGSFRQMLTEMTYGGFYEQLKREHPATQLFIGKIYDMCGYDAMKFHEAYKKCMAKAKDILHEETKRQDALDEEREKAEKKQEEADNLREMKEGK